MLKEIKTSCYEPLYTLTEAEKIIDLQRSRRSKNQKRVSICFFKQRACGALMIVLVVWLQLLTTRREWLLLSALR